MTFFLYLLNVVAGNESGRWEWIVEIFFLQWKDFKGHLFMIEKSAAGFSVDIFFLKQLYYKLRGKTRV